MTGILSHRQAWSQFVHDWELNSTSRNQQLIDHHSRLKSCRWLGLEVNFEKSESLWELLKTQETVDHWDLDLAMRNQQLIKHESALKNLSMIVLELYTTLWHSRLTRVVDFCSLSSIAGRSVKSKSPSCLQLKTWLQVVWSHSFKTWSAVNKTLSKVLDSCRDILWRDEERTALVCWKQLLTCLQLVWPHSIRTWSLINQELSASAWQLSGFFMEGWRMNTSRLLGTKSPKCLQLKTWLQVVWPHSVKTWSAVNKVQKVLDSCRDFLWKDEDRTPLICRENCLQLKTWL